MKEYEIKKMFICENCVPPDKKHECMEAVWSQGSACKKCVQDCYRRGWKKNRVILDNKKAVSMRLKSKLVVL